MCFSLWLCGYTQSGTVKKVVRGVQREFLVLCDFTLPFLAFGYAGVRSLGLFGKVARVVQRKFLVLCDFTRKYHSLCACVVWLIRVRPEGGAGRQERQCC